MGNVAVVYGRNSSAKQKSIKDQLTLCLADVEAQGWTLAGEPLSDPSSASRYKTKERANWARLLEMLPDIDIVVLWESSRGDRTLITWVAFLDSCREHGVRIHAVSHSRTYDPRKGRDYKTLAEDGVSSAYEADLISERVLRGQGESAAEGKPHSRTTYGYQRFYDPKTKEFNRQEPHPDQAPVVKDIIESIGGGEPLNQVVQRLNSTGVLTQRGGSRWFHSTVRGIATNAAYRPHPDNPQQGTRLHNGVEHVAQWPPLTTRQAFEAAGAVLGANSEKVREIRRNSPPGVIKYLLSGNASVATAMCGSALSGFCDTAGRGATYGCKACRCSSSPMPEVDEYVTRLVVARLSKKDARHLWVADNTATHAATEELARLRAELKEARASFATPGGISSASMAAKEAAMAPAIADAERRSRAVGTPLGALELIAAARLGKDRVRPMWDSLPLPARRDIVAGLFIRLTLSPATVRLTRWTPPKERLEVVGDRIVHEWRTP